MNDMTQNADPAELREHRLNAIAALLAPYIFQNMSGLRTLLEGFKASIMAEVKTMIEQQQGQDPLHPGQLGQAINDWLENNFDPAESITDYLDDNLEGKIDDWLERNLEGHLDRSVDQYLDNNLEDKTREIVEEFTFTARLRA